MYPKRSHILTPLTALVGSRGKGELKWTSECQKAFDTMKAVMAKDAFLKYPDHNKPFEVYCDASDLQLGAVIKQAGQPVAFYSRKLNKAQLNYTVGEKELLSVVETLKEYRTMLYGCPDITVYTDHRSNTFQNIQTQRVLRWRLFLEDYGVQFKYIKGELNSLADALSRLPFDERQNPRGSLQNREINGTNGLRPVHKSVALQDASVVDPPSDPMQAFNSSIDDDDLIDLFVHLPPVEHVPFVMDYPTIAHAQAGDAQLAQAKLSTPLRFEQRQMAPNVLVEHYRPAGDKPWKVYLPEALVARSINWYHLALSHIGSKRLEETMSMVFYHPQLRQRVESVIGPCRHCQQYKNVLRGHGQTASREAGLLPWTQVAVDLIGPWDLEIGGETIRFHALTIIDLVTNLVEIVRLDNKTSDHVAMHFVNTWLARYPKPVSCVHDQGGEFTGWGFQDMLERYDIKGRSITAKKSSSKCDLRMHAPNCGQQSTSAKTLQSTRWSAIYTSSSA
jgi:hypothetical protein